MWKPETHAKINCFRHHFKGEKGIGTVVEAKLNGQWKFEKIPLPFNFEYTAAAYKENWIVLMILL